MHYYFLCCSFLIFIIIFNLISIILGKEKIWKQHKEILELIRDTKPLLKEKVFSQDIVINSNSILILIGKIAAHLSIEDSMFYPGILKYNNRTVIATVQKFINEANDIKKVFAKYRTNWKNVSLIQANVADFLDETRIFLKHFSKRTEREEYELFSLVDNME